MTTKTDKIAIWAQSGTGEDFQCVHIDDAKDMENLLIESYRLLPMHGYLHNRLDLSDKIKCYLKID